MESKTYSSDLTESQWAILLPFIPAAKPGGRLCMVNLRAVVKGIFYRVKTGCQWRWLPHDYPPGAQLRATTVTGDATWQTVHDPVLTFSHRL